MNRFGFYDFKWFEKTPTSPQALKCKITDLIFSSWNARCRVENINPETGEYRIVLQGTIDWGNWNTTDSTK
ncbi:MAG: hypothetical protein CO189_06495 [candidate division Zixibacteria bacterium CG_4_9_14_3_um_filter_46_8]|nr:MAG: hypothetical protein CO189_06495 [candidate division Zixibacteria bacterium CG_4_9_14_3_um_filter_46_8]